MKAGLQAATASPGPGWTDFPARWVALLLAVVTIFLYAPLLRCDFVNYDDPEYVTANARVLAGLSLNNVAWAFTTGQMGNWHPLTWLSLMLDASLFGRNAAGFHFTNLIWHAFDAVLLFGFLLALTDVKWRSAAVAALFAWHPAHVESVAWVAERKDVLSTGLGFLSLWFYVLYARSGSNSKNPGANAPVVREQDRLYYGLSLLAFALGLLSKPMLVTWPGLLLLLDYWPLGRFQPGRAWHLLREKIPFLVLTAATCVVTFLVQQKEGAVTALTNLTLGMRAGNVLVSYVRYVGKLFWPGDLAVFYPHPGYWPLPEVLLATGLLAGVMWLVWARRGRYPFLLVGWLWYVGTLVPVIGLVQVGAQSLADRYTYIPSVGIFIALVWGVGELARSWPRPVLPLIASGALIGCAALTWQQVGYWQNSETLFRHALAVTKNNVLAHINLGSTLLDRGQNDAASHQFEAAIHLAPDFALAHYSLGLALNQQGQTNAAIGEFQTAIRLQPDYADAHDSLGSTLVQLGQTDAGIREMQEAIRLQPSVAGTHSSFGLTLFQSGQVAAAIEQFQAALRIDPTDADAHNNLGIALNQQGQTEAAIHEFQETLRLQPDRAATHYNLGVIFTKQGQSATAIQQFQEAIRCQPDYADAHNNLGFLFGQAGRLDEAIGEFKTTLQLRPDYPGAQNNLDRAVALKNQAK